MIILNDYKTSVHKALAEIATYESLPGLVVVGTHEKKTKKQVNAMISKIREARKGGIPFLGICFGHQLAIIEYLRNVAGFKKANSTELDSKTPNPVVVKLKERKTGIGPVTWFDNTVTYESWWHSYAMNPYYLSHFSPQLWGVSLAEHAVAMLRLKEHPFFWTTQFHPEYESSQDKPHKLLVAFIEACKKQYVRST